MGIIEGLLIPFKLFWTWLVCIVKEFIPRSRKDISGEVVFITGAGSGIGRLMSEKFAECGATVICTDINKATADETANNIRAKKGKALSYKLDVTNQQEVYDLAKVVSKETGGVTILVNNAGIVTGRNLLECPDHLIIKTMEVNTTSHFWTLKAFLGPMIKKNHGHVVSIASLAGYFGSPKLIDYTASKFAAVGLMEALTMELWTEADKVNTTTVCPYFIKTGMFAGITSISPLLPLMEPEYVADEILAGVLNNEVTLFIPRFQFTMLLLLKNLLPLKVGKVMSDFLGVEKQMDGFVGRSGKKSE